VARLLAEVGKCEDAEILAAALLHDTVEDTDTTHEELKAEFGDAVDEMVGEVTDDKEIESPTRKALQIQHAPFLSAGAKLIKIADKISNVREIGVDSPRDWNIERRREYFAWAREVVDATGRPNPMLSAFFDSTLEESVRLLAVEEASHM
jgi:guanosine-3',5'-bis(diphosphate) 3'-pyrophosphohydrolase